MIQRVSLTGSTLVVEKECKHLTYADFSSGISVQGKILKDFDLGIMAGGMYI